LNTHLVKTKVVSFQQLISHMVEVGHGPVLNRVPVKNDPKKSIYKSLDMQDIHLRISSS